MLLFSLGIGLRVKGVVDGKTLFDGTVTLILFGSRGPLLIIPFSSPESTSNEPNFWKTPGFIYDGDGLIRIIYIHFIHLLFLIYIPVKFLFIPIRP